MKTYMKFSFLKVTLTLLFLLINLLVLGNNPDSLKTLIAQENNDSIKAKLYFDLMGIYYLNDTEQLRKVYLEGRNYFEKNSKVHFAANIRYAWNELNSRKLSDAESIFDSLKIVFNDSLSHVSLDKNLAMLYYNNGRLCKAETTLLKVLPDSLEYLSGQSANYCRNTLGLIYLSQSRYDEAIALFKQILNPTIKSNKSWLMSANANLSFAMMIKGEYNQSIKYLYESVNLSKSSLSKRALMGYYLTGVRIYNTIGIKNLSREYLDKAKEIAKTLDHKKLKHKIQRLEYSIAIDEGKYDLAQQLFNNISRVVQEQEMFLFNSDLLDRRIEFLLLKKDTTQILPFVDLLLERALREKESYFEFKSYLHYASFYERQNLIKAKNYLNKALTHPKEQGNIRLKALVLEKLIKILEKEKNYKKALTLKNQLSLINEKHSLENINLDTLALIMKQLNTQDEADKSEDILANKNPSSFKKFIFLLPIVLGGGILLIYFFNKQKSKTSKAITHKVNPNTIGLNNLEGLNGKQNSEHKSTKSEKVKIEVNQLIRELQSESIDWIYFMREYERLDPSFFNIIQNKSEGTITTTGLKNLLCIKFKLSTKESSRLLNVSPHTVRSSRYRLKSQLGFEKTSNFVEFIEAL